VPEGGADDKEGTESQWEKRATILARENEKHRSRPSTPVHGSSPPVIPQLRLDGATPEEIPLSQSKAVSSKAIDEDIQEAIRLHEEGKLEASTALFARLADPKGANNPLSQVLYGLALRYVATFDSHAAVSFLRRMRSICTSGTPSPARSPVGTHRMAAVLATQWVDCPMMEAVTKLMPGLGTDGDASRTQPQP
jgi:hypothetical protein